VKSKVACQGARLRSANIGVAAATMIVCCKNAYLHAD
jgi:hypothetical protein